MRLTLALATVLFLVFTQAFAQDFQKGWEAAQVGDYATAMKEWEPLAKKGDATSQFNLGWMYLNGKGVIQDIKEAFKWYLLSANQGYASGQNNVGNMYAKGDGVPKDYAEAKKWYQLSAAQGYINAQNNLGNMYKYGYGVLQDNMRAHMWYNIASANGHKEAGKYRDEDAAQMTPENISKATAMARECMNSNYKNCGY